MSKKQRFVTPIKHLSLTFPRLPPYKKVDEFIASKKYLRSQEYRNYEWDKAGHDPRLNYYITQRVLHEANEKLKAKKEWAKEEYEKVDQQWKDLAEQEVKLRETFARMNEFIKSNEVKRIRAERKRKEEQVLKLKRTQDVEILQQKINVVTESKKQIDTNIAELGIYEDHLNSVVELTEEFVHADDILSRYEALTTTRNLLAQKQQDNLTELEMAKFKMTRLSDEYKFKVLGLNNTVADLNSRYNIAAREALHWENIVLQIQKRSFDKYQDLSRVTASVWNLYLLMCKRKGETPKYAFEDTEQMLIYIKKTLREISFVREALQAKYLEKKK